MHLEPIHIYYVSDLGSCHCINWRESAKFLIWTFGGRFRRAEHPCAWCDAQFGLDVTVDAGLDAEAVAVAVNAEPNAEPNGKEDPDPNSPGMDPELAGLVDWLINADPAVFLGDFDSGWEASPNSGVGWDSLSENESM